MNDVESIRKLFSIELNKRCIAYYKIDFSDEKFARDFYVSSGRKLLVSRETVRKWHNGTSYPVLENLVHLINWLDLDMNNIFIKSKKESKNSHKNNALIYPFQALSY